MRLSDAIRAGSAGTRQAFGRLFEFEDVWGGERMTVVGACAQGAAILATNGRLVGFTQYMLREVFTDAFQIAACPEKCSGPEGPASDSVWVLLAHLNDDHHWTREAIADWVQLQEARVAAPAETRVEIRELVGA